MDGARRHMWAGDVSALYSHGAEWIQSLNCSNCIHMVIITLGRECREWCNSTVELAVLQLIDENVNEEDAIVYSDGFIQRVDRYGWGFSARIRSTEFAEQSGAYRSTKSSIGMEIAIKTAALR